MACDLTRLTVGRLSRLIEARKISPRELVEACLDLVDRFDPAIAAFIEVTAKRARTEARTAESEIMNGRYRGPLHGIPFATKDIIDVAGLPTTCGSRLLRGSRAERDATCVARFSAAGAISLGKTATYEFATGGPSFDLPWSPTRNPWNLHHGPGGSSTGSAAAVAAGMVPLALGSDTGGSIRVPASYCGLTGLKPTFERIGVSGVWPLAPTFDTVGLLCRSAEDAALGLQVLAGADPTDRTSVTAEVSDYTAGLGGNLRGVRIGLVRHLYEGADDDVAVAMNEAVTVLRGLGAVTVDAKLADLEDYGACARIITGAEAFAIHRRAFVDDPGIFGEMFRYRVLPGILAQGSDYVAARDMRRKLTRSTLDVLDRFDVLITASTHGPAPAFASMSFGKRLRPFATVPFSVMRLPAISICNGFGKTGLPLSMQIVGRPFDEAEILRIAHAYQHETDWHERRPARDIPSPMPTTRMPDWGPSETSSDPATDRLIDACLHAHGVRLSDRQRQQLREGADSFLSMVRIVRDHGLG